MNFNTPILFIVFNRPHETQQSFEQIKKIKPKKLFIAGDGPRTLPLDTIIFDDHPGRTGIKNDKINCEKVRTIVSQIDWECEVHTLFHEKNLGCGVAPYTAINWFFDHVDEGIILEDDCIASPDFFFFCQKMLELYRHDTRIFHVSGMSYVDHFAHHPTLESYTYTRIPAVWGWATWKRAWQKYDFNMKSFEKFKKNNSIKDLFDNIFVQEAFMRMLVSIFTEIQTNPTVWDGQWAYTTLINNGLCVMPTKNLVSNIGFTKEATHTTTENNLLSNLPREKMSHETIAHPTFILPNKDLEAWTLGHIFGIYPPKKTLMREIKTMLKNKFPFLKQVKI
jgi:hypothetical protein